ncbi:RNI-like superfamily protein [Striga asiatica]|uniref:RNI-like superfamily protein n=1 Tax=Striga asiatica TaxID=4170 RepID=A0A5A7PIW2_STRAF|nr:RNI-like superfamily protein [Striga asiatica]
MEKGKGKDSTGRVTAAFCNLELDNNSHNSKLTRNPLGFAFQSDYFTSNRGKSAPSLLSLCLGVVGSNLEDIVDDLAEISYSFPSDIKVEIVNPCKVDFAIFDMVLLAVARRRKLLNDGIIIALGDSSFQILDISGSDVSDSGLCHIVDICQNLKAVDISQCTRLTSAGISKLLQRCSSLEILRWGGCPRSSYTARRCLSLLKPDLNDVEGESWEELDEVDFTHGAHSLRWLVWPNIDKDSLETLTIECPRIAVNPKPSLMGFKGTEIPREAFSQFALDDSVVKDIDPKTWAVSGFNNTRTAHLRAACPNELSVAEKFRLAFLDRDTRLAPKRAKNVRQHQRRAEREWVRTDARAKALALASKATRSVNLRNV